jgi:hypothetical protein
VGCFSSADLRRVGTAFMPKDYIGENTEYVLSRLHLNLLILNVEQQFKNHCKGRIKHCPHIIKLCANQLFYT